MGWLEMAAGWLALSIPVGILVGRGIAWGHGAVPNQGPDCAREKWT